jgi:uncharacterized protein (DUF1697 family)
MHLALLRGINVGGKAVLPMKDLAAIFAAAGASEVRTYIQSGNVVFGAPDAEGVVAQVTAEIAARYGYPGRIVLRSAADLATTYRANPFANAGSPIESLHVYFLADHPEPDAVSALDLNRSPGDSFAVVGRDVFLHLPNGMARTKLTNAYFDSKLKTVSTARNWKTVRALLGMMGTKAMV